MQDAQTDELQALLLPASAAAKLCGTSERTWRTWDSAGRIPQAVAIGRSKFWRRTELEAWVNQGCPRRETWNVIREDSLP
jgi:predicted DNA-binding transcriptional regulator AlpA